MNSVGVCCQGHRRIQIRVPRTYRLREGRGERSIGTAMSRTRSPSHPIPNWKTAMALVAVGQNRRARIFPVSDYPSTHTPQTADDFYVNRPMLTGDRASVCNDRNDCVSADADQNQRCPFRRGISTVKSSQTPKFLHLMN